MFGWILTKLSKNFKTSAGALSQRLTPYSAWQPVKARGAGDALRRGCNKPKNPSEGAVLEDDGYGVRAGGLRNVASRLAPDMESLSLSRRDEG
jgi:hypothetical protein